MALQDDEMRRLREAKAVFRERLLANPDVHGLGIGFKRKAGKKTKTLALVLHVFRKRPDQEIEATRRIPVTLEFLSAAEKKRVSVVTDVVEKAPPEPEACGACGTDFGARVRPVAGGFSFGLATAPGGTLGGYVWDNTTDQIVFLSNQHVIGGTAGATVIQPSIGDGGSSPGDNFGAVIRAGTLDAAIGAATNADDTRIEVECSTPGVYEIAEAFLGMPVEKAGQTTGLTCGLVELVDYDSGHNGSSSDLWIDGDGSDFSNSGDSGSLYVERTHPEGSNWKRIVGIHWGGSGDDGVGHPIGAVFSDLNLTTICAGIFSNFIESLFQTETESEPAHSRKLHKGIARDFEKAISSAAGGAKLLQLVRKHRVDLVEFLSTGDGRRVAIATLAPILQAKLTTKEILAHKLTARDIAAFQRAIETALAVKPKLKPLAAFGEGLLKSAQGKTLRSVILGPNS